MAALSPAQIAKIIADAKAANEARRAAAAAAKSGVVTTVQDLSKPGAVPAQSIVPALTSSTSFKSITGIPLNERQLSAVEIAMQQKSFCLIGAAGTGKTTTTREVISQLSRMSHVSLLAANTKYLNKDSPGIVILSFTNKAVNNIKKFLPEVLKRHCLTFHKVLEFAPISKFEAQAAGLKGLFQPRYNRVNKLPHISTVIVEESSMVDVDLFMRFYEALPFPERTQFIFLGDLNQLPPILGPSILGFKLTELPTVELTHVYRQALESPIITLAHAIRTGRGFEGRLTEDVFIDDRGEHGKVTIRPWKSKQESGNATKICLQRFLIPLVTHPDYDFENSVILCPFNKSFGTIALNQGVADALTKKRGALVYEVIGRSTRTYWAEGDRVIVDRREAKILKIKPAPGYDGVYPQEPSLTMDREGNDPNRKNIFDSVFSDATEGATTAADILDNMEINPGDDLDADVRNKASHEITVMFNDDGSETTITTAGEINSMLLGYILTVHKSQGSEWKNVYLLLHYTHNTMITRELIYTACTRAKDHLYIICEPDRGTKHNHVSNQLTRAAKNPEIKGITMAEKAEFFRGKKKEYKRAADAPRADVAIRRTAESYNDVAQWMDSGVNDADYDME